MPYSIQHILISVISVLLSKLYSADSQNVVRFLMEGILEHHLFTVLGCRFKVLQLPIRLSSINEYRSITRLEFLQN